jgi:hypothetical protein
MRQFMGSHNLGQKHGMAVSNVTVPAIVIICVCIVRQPCKQINTNRHDSSQNNLN